LLRGGRGPCSKNLHIITCNFELSLFFFLYKEEIPVSRALVSGSFSRKIWGEGEGDELPSILEETRVLNKFLGIFVDDTCFS